MQHIRRYPISLNGLDVPAERAGAELKDGLSRCPKHVVVGVASSNEGNTVAGGERRR